ncbi:hypothetical protein ACIPSA_26915 [Streptomyces sp. NPDC086549]|uniref:hypothetical protein n=1 Tax=Streptomyces sp. NPDC086549 TaxID=3365752 RepID=UPI0037F5B743
MGTSLTPEFWERFAVLLVVAVALTMILAATLDHVAVRLLSRRTRRVTTPRQPQGREQSDHRTSVGC